MENKELNLAICKEIAKATRKVWECLELCDRLHNHFVRQLNGRTLGAKDLLRKTDAFRNVLVCDISRLSDVEGMNEYGELTIKVGGFSTTICNANYLGVLLFNLDKFESLTQLPMKQRMMFGVGTDGTFCTDNYPQTAERLKEKPCMPSIGKSDYDTNRLKASQELLAVMLKYKDDLTLTEEEFVEKYVAAEREEIKSEGLGRSINLAVLRKHARDIYANLQKAKQRWHFAGDDAKKPAKTDAPLTPVLKQFYDLKKKHPNALLLFRCGNFYETYCEDAVAASKVLAITLTRSTKSKEKDGTLLRMAGFPYHALDTYLPKLIRAGYRVAICDQIETKPTTTKVSSGNHITDTSKKISTAKVQEKPTVRPSDTEQPTPAAQKPSVNIEWLYSRCNKATLEIVKAIMAA